MATKKQAKKPSKVKAKALPKPKVKAKAKPKAKQAREPEPAKPADEEPDDLALMLETLGCPVATADRLASVCVDSLERIDEDLGGVAAAQLVWAQDRTQLDLGAAAAALHAEMERHARAMIDLLGQLEPIADRAEDHPDLDPPEVLERLKPIFTAARTEE